jgi:hypothetical protein
MTATKTPIVSTYTSHALARADRAFLCSPFLLLFLSQMQVSSISLQDITENAGVDRGYTKKSLGELTAEAAVLWLIQVGLVRREVDGQGITDGFRLTLLGRQILGNYQNKGQELPRPSWLDRLKNFLSRWLRLPV